MLFLLFLEYNMIENVLRCFQLGKEQVIPFKKILYRSMYRDL